MAVSLGELILEVGLDLEGYREQMLQAELEATRFATETAQKLGSVGFKIPTFDGKQLNLTPTVNDTALTDLNKHLDLKQKHFQEVQKFFNSNPLKPSVDLSELKDLERSLQRASTQNVVRTNRSQGQPGGSSVVADQTSPSGYRYAPGHPRAGSFAPRSEAASTSNFTNQKGPIKVEVVNKKDSIFEAVYEKMTSAAADMIIQQAGKTFAREGKKAAITTVEAAERRVPLLKWSGASGELMGSIRGQARRYEYQKVYGEAKAGAIEKSADKLTKAYEQGLVSEDAYIKEMRLLREEMGKARSVKGKAGTRGIFENIAKPIASLVTAPARMAVRGFYEGVGGTYGREFATGSMQEMERRTGQSIQDVGRDSSLGLASRVTGISGAEETIYAAGRINRIVDALNPVAQKYGINLTPKESIKERALSRVDDKIVSTGQILDRSLNEDQIARDFASFRASVNMLTKAMSEVVRTGDLERLQSAIGNVADRADDITSYPQQAVVESYKQSVRSISPEDGRRIAGKPLPSMTLPADKNRALFVAGGFAGQQGRRGVDIATSMSSLVPDSTQVIPFLNSGFDTKTSGSQNAAKWASEALDLIVATVEKGYNEDAVRLAVKVKDFVEQNPDVQVDLFGHSAGGLVAKEAQAILKEWGVDAGTMTIGTPTMGAFSSSGDRSRSLAWQGDRLAAILSNSPSVGGVQGHTSSKYLENPSVQRALMALAQGQSLEEAIAQDPNIQVPQPSARKRSQPYDYARYDQMPDPWEGDRLDSYLVSGRTDKRHVYPKTPDPWGSPAQSATDKRLQGVQDALTRAVDPAIPEQQRKYLLDMAESVLKEVAAEIGQSEHIGHQFAQGIAMGMDQAQVVAEASANLANSAINAAKTQLDINSPSRKGIEIGEMYGVGVAQGIANSAAAVTSAAANLSSELLSGANAEEIKESALEFVTKPLITGFGTLADPTGKAKTATFDQGSIAGLSEQQALERFSQLLAKAKEEVISLNEVAETNALAEMVGADQPFQKLGEGWMGAAYRDKVNNRVVKYGQIANPLTDVQESEVLRQVNALGIGTQLGNAAIAPDGTGAFDMGIAQGSPIAAIANELSESDRRTAARKLLEQIKTLHSSGITHGDMHPGNVMLDEQMNPTIIDWGWGKTGQASQDMKPLADIKSISALIEGLPEEDEINRIISSMKRFGLGVENMDELINTYDQMMVVLDNSAKKADSSKVSDPKQKQGRSPQQPTAKQDPYVKAMYKQYVAAGIEITSGLSAGMVADLRLLQSAAKKIFDTVITSIKSLFKIASPSKVMMDIGKDIVQGLVVSLRDASGIDLTQVSNQVIQSAQQMKDDVAQNLPGAELASEVVSNVQQSKAGQNIAASAKSTQEATLKRLKSEVDKQAQTAKSLIASAEEKGLQTTKKGTLQTITSMESAQQALAKFKAEWFNADEDLGEWESSVKEQFESLESYLGDGLQQIKDFNDKALVDVEIPAEQKVESFGDRMKRVAKELLGFFAGLAVLKTVFDTFKDFAIASIDVAAEMERVGNTMTFVEGSSRAAADQIERIKSLSSDLGTDAMQGLEGYSQLAAATRGTALQGQQTELITDSIQQAAAVSQLDAARLAQANRAFTQISGKGTVSSEEIKQQLAEVGGVFSGILQTSAIDAGVTTEYQKIVVYQKK